MKRKSVWRFLKKLKIEPPYDPVVPFLDTYLKETKILIQGTSLLVQWQRFHAPSAGGPGSIPGQGTRSHILQLRVRMPQLKIPHAATKDLACCN